jgi:hypothetical protein
MAEVAKSPAGNGAAPVSDPAGDRYVRDGHHRISMALVRRAGC